MNRRVTARQSASFTKRKRGKSIVYAITAILAVFLAGYSIHALTHLNALTIRTIDITGTDAEQAELLKATAFESLQGDYGYFFSKANSFLFSKHSIVSAIRTSSARIQSVSVSRTSLQALAISVTEKAPAALICDSLPNFDGSNLSFESNDSCYFADEQGIIFTASPSFSGQAYNRYYVPAIDAASTTVALLGSQGIPGDQFKKLQNVYESVRASGIVTEALLVQDNGEYELYVRNPVIKNVQTAQAGGTVVIYMNSNRPLEDQASNLISFWNHMVAEAQSHKTPIVFDSIDVRYGSNVFYRRVGE